MKYIIAITFNPQDGPAIAPLVPQEQAHVKQSRERGILEAVYISADRVRVWMVMNGESQEQVEQELKEFPLYPYMQPEIIPLS